MASLGLNDPLPLIPVDLLKKHQAYEKHDTRFRSAARLLQALWREQEKLPVGTRRDRYGRARRSGSLIGYEAAEAGRNFLTPALGELAHHLLAYREPGALIERGRFLSNALSSCGFTVNLFGPLWLDRALATTFLRMLLPDRDIADVVDLRLEHSPGRMHILLTGDRTAFDFAAYYRRSDGRRGAVFVEVKYSETFHESTMLAGDRQYDDLAEASGIFKEPAHVALRVNPLAQLFREHLLAQAAVIRGDVEEATFLLIAPHRNDQVQRVADLYPAFLTKPVEGQVPFVNMTLEGVLAIMASAGAPDRADAVFDRYLAFDKVDDAVTTFVRERVAKWASPSLTAKPPLMLVEEAA